MWGSFAPLGYVPSVTLLPSRFCPVTLLPGLSRLSLPYSEGGHRSSKLWPCSSIGWKWRRGSLRELERRSLRTAAGLKNCRHKGLTRPVASKRPLPVGEPPGSDRHCWCKRSWKEYSYRRKSRHFRHDPSPGPRRIRKHAPFERNGNINDCGGQRGSSFSKGTPQAEREFCCGDDSLRQELPANDAICPGHRSRL